MEELEKRRGLLNLEKLSGNPLLDPADYAGLIFAFIFLEANLAFIISLFLFFTLCFHGQ